MATHRANHIIRQRDAVREALEESAGELGQISVLKEAYETIVSDLLRFEDEGWVKIQGYLPEEKKGFSLEDIKKTTKYLERQVKVSGNLLGRGLRLKNNHAFGRGFTFKRKDGEKIQPRFQAIMDDPENQEAIFSPTAVKELNRILFTSGNLLVVWDTKNKKFSRLSIDLNVDNYISDEVDQGKIKFILRTYERRNDLSRTSGETDTIREWIPTASRYLSREKMPRTIRVGTDEIPVRSDLVIIDKRINKDNGEVWGVPDAFAAAPWAHIYSNYLKDGGKLFHALAAISYLVKVKTEAAAKSAGAKLQNGRVAQAAITGPDTEIQTIPRANSVDLYDGRPIQAAVAAALDVAVTAIAADPGTGGSYASENALSEPERAAALSRQEDMAEFFSRVFLVMGAKGIVFDARRLDVDPVHRQMSSLGLARTLGGINQEEYRLRSIELLDIDPTTNELPEPDEFTGSQASTLVDYISSNGDSTVVDNAGSPSNPVPSQGNSGAVGSLDDNGNDARNSDNSAGLA